MTRAEARLQRVDSYEESSKLRLVDGPGGDSERERRQRAREALEAFERRVPLDDPVYAPDLDPVTGRRTVRITGRPEATARARRSVTVNRISSRPDRVAMWAVMLGLLLAGMSAATARAADAPAASDAVPAALSTR